MKRLCCCLPTGLNPDGTGILNGDTGQKKFFQAARVNLKEIDIDEMNVKDAGLSVFKPFNPSLIQNKTFSASDLQRWQSVLPKEE